MKWHATTADCRRASGSPYSYNNLYDAVGEGATYKTVYNSILEAKVKTKMEKYPDLSKTEATESVEEDIQKAIRYKLVEAYRKEGMNAKEIKSKIRKSATTYFKDIYINGTPEDRARVKNKMVALGVYDSNNEVLRICSNWFNNYCK